MGFIDTIKARAKADKESQMLFWLVAKKQSKKAVKDWIFPVQRS